MTAPRRMIETFELDGAPQSSAADPRNGGSLPRPPSRGGRPRTGPELVADAVAKPVSAWLPAGAHAEAVVLAGVDASAGVSSQGDPRPVLLRITGPAWTAAQDGTALQVDVDGCTVTGAAHGDLSSEKVYVRLRTMTCAVPEPGTGERPGAVVETDVAGFVAGSGKTGVRGPVVSREGALVEKAFLAGMVSGIGQGVAQAFQPQAVATGTGAAVANTGLGDIGRAGLGAGASIGRPEGRRLHDPPRRAVPAGGPAPGRDEGDAGVPRRRPHRRPTRRRRRKPLSRGIDMTHDTKRTRNRAALPVAAIAALLLAGCSTGHIGESWQCPLAEGGLCDSVAAADPAVPERKAAETTVLAEPLWRVRATEPNTLAEAPCAAACGEGFDPFAWLARLLGGGGDDGEGHAGPDAGEPGPAMADAAGAAAVSPTAPAGTEPRPGEPAAALLPAEPGAAPDGPDAGDLRTDEVVARIWIAPFVDTDGVYREAAWVRAVLEPAGWRLP